MRILTRSCQKVESYLGVQEVWSVKLQLLSVTSQAITVSRSRALADWIVGGTSPRCASG